jgi:arsenate reductase (thioredoxin)
MWYLRISEHQKYRFKIDEIIIRGGYMLSKQSVLFLCTGNACRSQMAEALFRKHGGNSFDVYSAGLEPRGIDPMTIDVLQEIGIDTSKLNSKSLSVYMGFKNFNYMITVCAKAEKNCPTLFPSIGQRLYWPFNDPATFVGPHSERIELFRRIRNEIENKILVFLATEAH